MGGSFNPITEGHVDLAQKVLLNSDIEEVWVVPCYDHLKKDKIVDTKHRIKMCEIALQDYTKIKVFDYEIAKKMDGSTYDFLSKLLKDSEYEDYEFSYIIGEDNAHLFDEWKNPEELKKLLRFITVPRQYYSKAKRDCWYNQEPHLYLDVKIRNICSTSIRGWIKIWWEGKWADWSERKLEGEIHPLVFEYIKNKNLYQDR
jgi:nicotinate-nucleotide adenylyltransferase